MAERTRAGSRHARFRTGFNRLSETRLAWLRTHTTNLLGVSRQTAEQVIENYGFTSSEHGDHILLIIPVPGRSKPLFWDITGMTTEELEAFRDFFTYLVDLAEPVVRERDRIAKDAFEKGDDSYTRLYRQLPQFVVREKQVPSDSQGLQHGPSDDAGADGPSGD